MPAVLVEAGFIDSPEDNRFFDQNFQAVAQAVLVRVAHGVAVEHDVDQTADLAEAPCLTGAPAPAGAEELWGEDAAALSGRCLRAPVPAHGVRIYKLS